VFLGITSSNAQQIHLEVLPENEVEVPGDIEKQTDDWNEAIKPLCRLFTRNIDGYLSENDINTKTEKHRIVDLDDKPVSIYYDTVLRSAMLCRDTALISKLLEMGADPTVSVVSTPECELDHIEWALKYLENPADIMNLLLNNVLERENSKGMEYPCEKIGPMVGRLLMVFDETYSQGKNDEAKKILENIKILVELSENKNCEGAVSALLKVQGSKIEYLSPEIHAWMVGHLRDFLNEEKKTNRKKGTITA
jgi:hypothetical protein